MLTQFLKRLFASGALALALLGVHHPAAAQLSVGPSGLAPQTFDTAPPVSSWSMGSIGPRVAGGVFLSGSQLDDAVQTNSLAVINLTLRTNTVVPPTADGYAQWNSTGFYLQTRPNTNWYTLLMATLRNNTGTNISFVTLSYNLATVMAAGVNPAEEISGHRAYFSLTGTAGSWIRIPQFDSPTDNDSSAKSAVVNLGSWAPNANLYVLWADGNAVAAIAGANQEGAYTIDNFAVSIPNQSGPPNIVSQPQSQSVGFPNTAIFSVGAIGSNPLFYQWFKNGTPIDGANSSVYSIANATLADQGSYTVLVSNSLGNATSSAAVLTVTCAGGTVAPSITTHPANQTLASGGTINLSVTASGTAPLAYQWLRRGVPIPGATSSTFTKTGAQAADSALYSVTVANCAGAVTSSNALVAIATPPFVLMGLTNQVWRYEQSGNSLGTAWRAINFNDSAWPTGRGVFAFENNATVNAITNTVLNNFTPADYITRYFRTSFVLNDDPASISLVASNYVDDGIVVYLNGVEAFRYNMPGGGIQFGTLASAANPAGEGVPIVSNLPPSLLVQGTNVIAVELHQSGPDSSDTVFGMAILATLATPSTLSIVAQPQSVAIEETKPATFSVGVQGAPVYYQWFRDGTAIPNATSNPYTIPIATSADAGIYYVVVSNSINSVTSSLAALTIRADTNAPILIGADGTESNTLVLVSFSERVATSATNLANFKITNTLGGTLVISRAVLTNGTNVLLTTAARVPNNNYLVIVSNVRDISPAQNLIVANSMYPIRTLVRVMDMTGYWKYLDPFPPFDPDPASLGTAWREFTFDDSTWAEGAGVFFNGIDQDVVSAPVSTFLSQTPVYVTYFRAPVSLQVSPGGLQFQMTHLVDDGAVFYINGDEFFRFNMPSGPVVSNTRPATVVGNVVREGPISLPINSIRQGSNILAVELHQDQAPDLDKVFGAEIDANVQSFIVGPVMIVGGPGDLFAVEGQPATFQVVQVGGARFQWQQNSNNIAGATNFSYTIPVVTANLNGMQFRVGVSNSVSGLVFSTNATLRVLADTNPPTLVAAKIGSNNTIVVSFSEPLGAASANNRLNYTVTNSSGTSLSVNSATLVNNTNVVLSFNVSLAGRYVVVVNNVTDAATIANTITPNSAATVGADYFMPFDAAWKYLITNTNDAIQAAYMGVNFNDVAWSGPSNGLFYVEGATLPGPKNTELVNGRSPPTDDNGNYINTFYFRRTFVAPVGASNVSFRIRHIIDDGFVLYLNGVELLRFNMAAGAVTAATQANGTPGDGALVGPVEVIANLVGGTNVLAAEVHQSGAASSDITFGLEMEFGVPSVVIPPPSGVQILTQPQNRTNAVGTTAAFNVLATGATPLFYQWRKNGQNINNATNAAFSLANVQLSDNGSTYSVVVSNAIHSVTSSAATLTVTNTTGGTCTNLEPRLVIQRQGTNVVLSWANPTNSCGAVVPYLLRSTTALPVPPAAGVWVTNIVSVPLTVGPTNTARFFQLIKQ